MSREKGRNLSLGGNCVTLNSSADRVLVCGTGGRGFESLLGGCSTTCTYSSRVPLERPLSEAEGFWSESRWVHHGSVARRQSRSLLHSRVRVRVPRDPLDCIVEFAPARPEGISNGVLVTRG